MPTPSSLNNEIREMLMDCGLFITLTPAEFSAVSGYFSISSIDKGQAIFSEGDAGSFMCIIHSGSVSVQKLDGEGRQVETAVLRSGRAFGEMAVLDGERRSATCIAAAPSVLLSLGKDSLDKMLNEAPKIAAKIIRAIAIAMSRRLRMMDGQVLAQQE
jgi:CRP-like cAMP-binding protein